MEYDFTLAYRRLIDAIGVKSQIELADVLGVRQSSISDAISRGSLPPSWLLTMVEKFALNPAWIKTGEGPKYLQPSDDKSCLGKMIEHRPELVPVLSAIVQELFDAECKHPEWPMDAVHASAVLNEEAGELTQAALDFHFGKLERKGSYGPNPAEHMQDEAKQVGAMAVRFLSNAHRYLPQRSVVFIKTPACRLTEEVITALHDGFAPGQIVYGNIQPSVGK